MKREVPAYLTVYLALTLGILMALSLVLIQGARQSVLQLEAVCVADIGMDSVMAEYHRELFRRFNLLALDTSYGTKTVGRENVYARLEHYLGKNLEGKAAESFPGLTDLAYKDFLGLKLKEAELPEVCLLTDENGSVFRSAAAESVRDDFGVSAAAEILQWFDTVKQYELDTRDVEAEKKEADEQVEAMLKDKREILEDEWETENGGNPIAAMEERKKNGIISLILGEGTEVSPKSLNTEGLIGQRIRDGRANQGNAESQQPETAEKIMEGLWFQEYLIRYLGNYVSKKQGSALDYELEYAIAGKRSDADNFKSVLLRILAIREADNARHLHMDKVKYGEASLVALGISLLAAQPELQEPLCEAIILGWAYAESVYDLRTLTSGGKIPLIKDSESWHYDLQTILEDLWADEKMEDLADDKGLRYEDYLRILILLTDAGTLNLRVMDLVEADIRMTPGNSMFRLDGCYLEMSGEITFESGFGYAQTVSVRKKYE